MAAVDGARHAKITILAAQVVALLDLVSRLLRLGVLVKFISGSILVGFKSGAGITIEMTQLPSIFSAPGGRHSFLKRAWMPHGQLGQAWPLVLPQSLTRAEAITPLTSYRRRAALSPLALLIIDMPCGLAAVIVFTAMLHGSAATNSTVAITIADTLLLGWIVMIYVPVILAKLLTHPQIVAFTLRVVETALGLQIIFRSLKLLGILKGIAS